MYKRGITMALFLADSFSFKSFTLRSISSSIIVRVDVDDCGFKETVIIESNTEVDRREVLGVLLGLVQPESDFDVAFHSKNIKKLILLKPRQDGDL